MTETANNCGCASQRADTGGSDDSMTMPRVTFSTFVLSLASSALAQLGEVPNPETGQLEENLELARHTIDVLTMLRDKTTACLDDEEKRLLEGLLYEVRMKYVIKTRS